jgi:hypothetical protein
MNPEKDKELCEKYPILYAQRDKSMQDTCMCWGFECGDGWARIIDELSAKIEDVNREILADQKRQWKIAEWLGTIGGFSLGASLGTIPLVQTPLIPILTALLSILLSWQGIRLSRRARDRCFVEASQVKEKFGTIRFYIGPVESKYDDRVYEWIDQAEEQSSKTCEHCGAPGKERSGGWILTLCDDCQKKRDAEYDKYREQSKHHPEDGLE